MLDIVFRFPLMQLSLKEISNELSKVEQSIIIFFHCITTVAKVTRDMLDHWGKVSIDADVTFKVLVKIDKNIPFIDLKVVMFGDARCSPLL